MTIQNDISSSNLQMHVCTVERVYPSGLVDARSDRDRFFEQINSTFGSAEGNYTIGCRCVVVSDGSQHYSLGQIREPTLDDSGSVTTKNINNDLSDLTNAKALVATDNFGSQAKVVAAPGGGVILDSGENALMHLDPGNAKVVSMSDRSETMTVPHYANHDHNGVTAQSNYKWRTTADLLSWDRDVARDRNDALDIGGILTVDVGPTPDMLTIEYKLNNAVLSSVTINTTGEIEATSGVAPLDNKMKLSPTGITLKSGSSPTASSLTINPVGQITLGGPIADTLGTLSQTLNAVGGLATPVQVITIFGPVPLLTSPVFTALHVALQSIKPPGP